MIAVGRTLIDRYHITGYIHKGGMGAVYHAHDRLDNIVVAVKQSFHAERDLLREQFRREATLLRRLDHPALPKVHNYFTEGEGQFLVMDYIEGEDLEHLLQRTQGPLPLEQVLKWADQILDALDYLHTNKPVIIHRDIKPANLKLAPSGGIMLLDFGLAKNETTPTLPGRSIAAATPAYAPPEQISREGTDPRSDLFSFGATLYHLLTNQCPISSGIRDGVVKQGARDPLRPAHEINPLIPPAISGVIHKAMAIARDQRYTDAAAMRVALREATGSGSPTLIDPPPPQPAELRRTQPRPPTAPPPTTPQPVPEPLADLEKTPTPAPALFRLRKPLLIGVAAGLVVSALLVYWLSSGQSPTPVESSAPVDVLSYSLEYKPDERNKFRFNFKSRRNGFLYIVAPNTKNQWITFLTARPHPETGVNDNEIEAGQDYQFFGGGRWIVMRADPASFTLIFTTKKLSQHGFLNVEAGSQLSEDDNRALDELRRQSQTRKPQLDADGTGAAIRALEASDAPLVTDIRVAWNARGN